MRTSKWCEIPVLLGVITWLGVGCTASPTLTPSLSVSTAMPSPTIAPTVTPTRSPMASPTATPIPTSTLTPAPTLSAEAREAYAEELLKTNAGCELPCWWGIVPGETTWAEAERFLLQMGARTSSNLDFYGDIFHGTGGFDFMGRSIYNRIGFWEHEGIVESVQIHAEGGYNLLDFRAVWAHFSPEQVISTYGQPARVWVQTFASPHESPYGDTMAYDLWLFYDDLGFLVRYTGQTKYEPVYRMCPTFGESDDMGLTLEMYLQSPDGHVALERLVGERMGDPSSIRPIEEAAGLSVEEFYALFTQNEQPICFKTPRDIWP